MTAEAAVAVPTLVMFTMGLVWALMAASAQIQCVDAARAGARAAARSEPRAQAVAAARSAAPSGSDITLTRSGDLWRVRVEADTPGPGALALTLSAEAAALAEDTVGQGSNAMLPDVGPPPDRRGKQPHQALSSGGSGRRAAAWQATPERGSEDTVRNAVPAPAAALVAASGPAPASQVHGHRGDAQELAGGHVLVRADRGGRESGTGPVRVGGVPGARRAERLGTATAAAEGVTP